MITTASTESELAAVVAHEISHVTQRHLARRLESQDKSQPLAMAGMISSILLTLINPSMGIAALSTTMAASQQAGINYTRGNEKEADRVGIALLANSDFDPQGAPDCFATMAEKYRYKSKPPAMLLTHPLPESRISDARIRAQNYSPRPLPPSLQFELAKARITARYEGNAKDHIINFQLSLILYIIIGIPAILLFGLGIVLLIFTGMLSLIMPIVNAVKASNGEAPSYFGTIKFIS